MFEKCNPSHPDKIADQIAGAMVDMAYLFQRSPKVSIEVLIGNDECNIVGQSSYDFTAEEVCGTVRRIVGRPVNVYISITHAEPSKGGPARCSDSGIFRGVPVSGEERVLSERVRVAYKSFRSEGKYVCFGDTLVSCQSNATAEEVERAIKADGAIMIWSKYITNPLGSGAGGAYHQRGATNRKLMSDMGRAACDGGLHGKDLGNPDVSVNVFCHILAQQMGEPVELACAIGDEKVGPFDYEFIVSVAKDYIFNKLGGFEELAKWGLI